MPRDAFDGGGGPSRSPTATGVTAFASHLGLASHITTKEEEEEEEEEDAALMRKAAILN